MGRCYGWSDRAFPWQLCRTMCLNETTMKKNVINSQLHCIKRGWSPRKRSSKNEHCTIQNTNQVIHISHYIIQIRSIEIIVRGIEADEMCWCAKRNTETLVTMQQPMQFITSKIFYKNKSLSYFPLHVQCSIFYIRFINFIHSMIYAFFEVYKIKITMNRKWENIANVHVHTHTNWNNSNP